MATSTSLPLIQTVSQLSIFDILGPPQPRALPFEASTHVTVSQMVKSNKQMIKNNNKLNETLQFPIAGNHNSS